MIRHIIAVLLLVGCLLSGALLLPGCYAVYAGTSPTTASGEQTLLTPPGTPPDSSSGEQTVPAPSDTETSPPPTTQPATGSDTVPTDPTATAPSTEETVPTPPAVWQQPGYVPQCKFGFVYDVADDRLLYERGSLDTRVYPASLTKMFSVYVASLYMAPDEVVTVGQEVTYINEYSSKAFLSPGNRLTVSMLMEGMMICSGNDAAYALAAATGYKLAGTTDLEPMAAVQRFVEEMNVQAQKLGLTGSHFTGPDGIHNDNHYTTPRDLLKIMELAMGIEAVRECVKLSEKTVTFLSGEERTWMNTNALVHPELDYYCPDAVGLKTGYETTAGHCLAAVFSKGDSYIFLLVLKGYISEVRFEDALWLYENYIQ